MTASTGAHFDRLDDRARIHLAREGGVAYLPALARPREVALAACSPVEQDAVRAALGEAQKRCCPPQEAGRGDQRYFRVVIVCPDAPDREETLIVPEAQAPGALVRLWESGPRALSDTDDA